MKLTDNDFTSHVCNDADKDGDGLGWNLDTDLTTEGKNEIIQALKLQKLVKEEIRLKNIELQKILKVKDGIKSCGSDYHLIILNDRDKFTALIQDSEK